MARTPEQKAQYLEVVAGLTAMFVGSCWSWLTPWSALVDIVVFVAAFIAIGISTVAEG
jgi:hypothetical protein